MWEEKKVFQRTKLTAKLDVVMKAQLGHISIEVQVLRLRCHVGIVFLVGQIPRYPGVLSFID
jgi:hypothetical protein